MDPVTLFALANGAVSAIKAGCKLYKDIKGAAGDISEVLKDLDKQFHNAYEGKGKKPSPEAIKQFNEEKARIKENNKRSQDTPNIYQEIGDHLGKYYDNYYKCMAIFEEEERRAHTTVYKGDDSIGKRALQRVLMRKQLQQMEVELRELMIYQSPPELGALYTEVEQLMKEMGKEQSILVAQQMKREAIEEKRRLARQKKVIEQLIIGIGIFILIFVVMFMFMLIIGGRIERHPELGNCPMPKGSWLYEKWTTTVFATCK